MRILILSAVLLALSGCGPLETVKDIGAWLVTPTNGAPPVVEIGKEAAKGFFEGLGAGPIVAGLLALSAAGGSGATLWAKRKKPKK